MNNTNSIQNSKKNIKWYTYVDSSLEKKLKNFMEQFNLSKQAEIIRDSVNSYIDFVQQVYDKDIEAEKYDKNHIHQFIINAIKNHEIYPNFYEELKQRLSPLKTLILMQENLILQLKSNKLAENVENSKKAIMELENLIKLHYEKPNLLRHFKKFDILHIEEISLYKNKQDCTKCSFCGIMCPDVCIEVYR